MLAELVILAAAASYPTLTPYDNAPRRPAPVAPAPAYEAPRVPAYAAPLPPVVREREPYERTFYDPPPVTPMREWFK